MHRKRYVQAAVHSVYSGVHVWTIAPSPSKLPAMSELLRRVSGGPQLGSGRPSIPPEWKRERELRIKLRESEWQDMCALAQAWQLPRGTIGWAIVHERLAEWRGDDTSFRELGPQLRALASLLRDAR